MPHFRIYMMKIVLLHFPISDMRYAYPSFPSLSAFLKQVGNHPISKDVNPEGRTEID